MAPRAYWNGSLKLSLVTCPIALYPASTQAEKTHFHQINIKTGHRLKQQLVDEQTGRVVDKDHKGRATKSPRADTSRSTRKSSRP
jgi:DNA end-binding protein Ku